MYPQITNHDPIGPIQDIPSMFLMIIMKNIFLMNHEMNEKIFFSIQMNEYLCLANTYRYFNTRWWMLTWRHFGIFTIIQAPLNILSQFTIERFQVFLEKTGVISKANTI